MSQVSRNNSTVKVAVAEASAFDAARVALLSLIVLVVILITVGT